MTHNIKRNWWTSISTSAFLGTCLAATMAAATAEALPVLSEVYYDAPGSDDGQIFVEIAGLPGTLLDGYRLEGVNGSNGAFGPSIILRGTIAADGLFVVADRTSSGVTSVLNADLLANFDFQNGPDSVVLLNGEEIVDALGYGVFGFGEVFAGEGEAAPDVAPGSSLARIWANIDSDDNAADFAVSTLPSPGTAPLAAIPEPGSALLLGLGLVGLTTAGGARESQPVRSRKAV